MKTKLLALFLAVLTVVCCIPVMADGLTVSDGTAVGDGILISPAPSTASTVTAGKAAEALHTLGLVGGYATSDGSVNFALGDKLTRAQAFVLVVRYVGAEREATANAQAHPFTDVPDWASAYIGYVYANGITKGVSETKFDPDSEVSEAAFLTIMLRVLGYDDGAGDFAWNDPYAKAKEVGLCDARGAGFDRGGAFVICYRALTAKVKSGKTMGEQLIDKGVFTRDDYEKATAGEPETPDKPETVLTPIAGLNTKGADGDHANDDYTAASLEIDYRQSVELTSGKTGYSRYDNAWYPRVKKVRDDLYLLLYHYGQFGQHIYWTSSKDCINWDAPQVLFSSADHIFTYEDGELSGTQDRIYAVNADACVLDNGDILCVYSVRPCKGYQTYIDLSGLELVRGKVSDDGKITWSEPTKIYTGINWEPFIMQRDDGQIEIYFSSSVGYISKYGFDKEIRSACAGLIVSGDGGYSWTPDIQPGNQNYYAPIRTFQQYLGDRVAPNGETVPYFGGQMPSAVQLYNGRTMLAVEVRQFNDSYTISYATSPVGGDWKDLGMAENGPTDTMVKDAFDGAAPYLARFLSGEVYLTYTDKGLKGKIGSADGTEVSSKAFQAVPGAAGSWGSTEIVGSHAVLSTAPVVNGSLRGVKIVRSYLNHRINAPKTTVKVDGYTNDWDEIENTDALFVGSETQAQITLRVAHDDENIYFLISRLDYYLTDGDTATVCIASGTTADYRIEVGLDGIRAIDYYANGAKQSSLTGGSAAVKVLGTVGNNEDRDEGYVVELAIPKSLVGLSDASSFKVRPALSNTDGIGATADTLTGISTFSTTQWPSVVLD